MTEIVRARVLKPGHDRVFTGAYDERTRQFTKFSEGEEFEIAADIAAALVERGFAEVVATAAAVAPCSAPLVSRPPTTAAPASPTTWRLFFPDVPAGEVERKQWSALAISRLARNAKRNAESGCLEWKGATHTTGYGVITLLRKNYAVHRLSWLAHRGDIAPGLLVCHACDNPSCFEISHLFLGSPKENTDDMVRKGRARRSGRPTLTEAQVIEIKRRLAERQSILSLSREYKMCYAAIAAIKHGRSWRHVKPAP